MQNDLKKRLKQKFVNWEEAFTVLKSFLDRELFSKEEFIRTVLSIQHYESGSYKELNQFPTSLFKNPEFRKLTELIFGKEYLVDEEVKSYVKMASILSNLDPNLPPIKSILKFLIHSYKEIGTPFYTATVFKKLTEALEEIYV